MSMRSYEDIHKELINLISRDDSLAYISKNFNDAESDSERVAKCYNLLRDYELLPKCKPTKRKKSLKLSEKFRNDGNRAFIHKDDMLAMYYYTQATACALTGSKEISLAYANRSAVTFSLGDLLDAIKDIDRALCGDYPVHLKYKLWERKGKSFMELGNYLEAQNALKISIQFVDNSHLDKDKNAFLVSHLQGLIEECFNETVEMKPTEAESLPDLTHGTNPSIHSGSNAINVAYSLNMGRHLVATADINPGDVLAVEKPFSSVSLPNSYLFFCYHCHKRCHSLLPCLECTTVLFCDETCRSLSWAESHSIECGILTSLMMLGCGKLELLALRVLINSTTKGRMLTSLASSIDQLENYEDPNKKGFSNEIYLSDSYKSIHNLEGNTHLRNVSYLFGRSVVASCILHILDTLTDFFQTEIKETDIEGIESYLQLEQSQKVRWDKIFAGGLILRYLQSMASNAHEISEMRIYPNDDDYKIESSEIGSAAYSLLSLINHSCDPNVVRHSYLGSTVVLTAIRVIKKGEQIFDNYSFHHATHKKEERHFHLKSQYLFSCYCIACSNDWPLYGDLPHKEPLYLDKTDAADIDKSSKEFRKILYRIISDHNKDKLVEWLTFLCSHLKLLERSIARPWKEHSECQEAIKQCLSLQANHYIYKCCPSSLLMLRDSNGVIPY